MATSTKVLYRFTKERRRGATGRSEFVLDDYGTVAPTLTWVIIRGASESAVVAEGKLAAERKSCEYSVSVEPTTGKLAP